MSTHAASAKELFVLGRLSMRPTYGHEIMRTLSRSRADLWAELSEKHVYYILNKFEGQGLVDITERDGGDRPSRKVYSLTSAGVSEFERLMHSDSLVTAVPYSDFDVVFGLLAYTDRLSADEKTDILLRRAEHLRSRIAEAGEATGRAIIEGETGLPLRVFTKVARIAEAELTWLEEIIADVTRDGWESARGRTADGASR